MIGTPISQETLDELGLDSMDDYQKWIWESVGATTEEEYWAILNDYHEENDLVPLCPFGEEEK